jgi:two-component system sensor histidine kinase/response regulator
MGQADLLDHLERRPRNRIVEMRERDYDARERPWFKGAMALPDDRVFWTEPYIFFTTKEPGITAAMRWTGADGSTM